VRTKLLAFCNIYNNAHEPAGAPINLLQKKKQQLTAPFLKGDEPSFLYRHAEISGDLYHFSPFKSQAF